MGTVTDSLSHKKLVEEQENEPEQKDLCESVWPYRKLKEFLCAFTNRMV